MSVNSLAAPRLRFFLIAALATPFAHADDAAIARVEAGLRPAIALASAPVKTESLQEAMTRLKVPGVSVAVIKDGELAWARGYGVAWIGGPAVTPHTLFQTASVSKPVSAMAALRMVEQGKLDLDAGIDTALTSWRLPDSQDKGRPNLRQLLSHTGGVSVPGFPGYAAGKRVPTLVQVLDGAWAANTKAIRVDTAPGTAWRYSGGGYTVLQQAMIDRAGKPFEVLMQESVLAPLGMLESTFAQPLPTALQASAARPHGHDGEPFAGGAYTHPEQAAAGLWSTPSDLAKFAIAIQQGAAGGDNGVLSPAMTRTMLQPVMNDYALGLQISEGGKGFGHGGVNVGFQSWLYGSTEGGDGVVVLTNGDNGGELAAALTRAIAHEYKWAGQQTRLRTTVELAPSARQALVGKYRVDGIGDFEVAEREGRLMVAIRRGPWEPLYAESDKVLFILSRNLEMRPSDADSGHTVVGSSSRAYRRL
ncbi:CubicO group peptidase (beta-lactamase class C family) [Massilia sp. UYP11]|uniref:serine hydrolase domain-containing protein n=1 Tax=Massilia sp. UYP11 TaxID=1756385 RepID=UPI003D1EA6F1